MLFNSYPFVLAFLPLCAVGWHLLNRLSRPRLATLFLLAMSLWFYAANDLRGLSVLLVSAVVNWAIGRRLTVTTGGKGRLGLAVLGVLLNLGALGLFKYTNFILQNLGRVTGHEFGTLSLILPLGISFFTFQQIAYLIDAWKGQAERYSLAEYAVFVSFFPYVMSGPIAFHSEILPQLRGAARTGVNWDNVARGLTLFSWGLAKKVLIADVLGQAANAGWNGLYTLTSSTALFTMFAYTLQLYYDFSGYCDMATGVARLFNIELPRNFDSPYRACSIQEFWKGWHMTMTRFFTRYLYIPLGGSRRGLARTCLNTMIIFLVSGLWHGASWTFIFWGGLHGAAMVLARLRNAVTDRRLPRPLGWLLTFLFVNVAWVFFRAPNLHGALVFFRRLLFGHFYELPYSIYGPFLTTEIKALNGLIGFDTTLLGYWIAPLFLIGALLLALVPGNALDRTLTERFRPSRRILLCSAFLLVWSVLSFSGVSTFLYFTF